VNSTQKVQADFDQAAANMAQQPPARAMVLRRRASVMKYVPPHCGDSLEIGCGLGDFTRYLAGRSTRVLALDLSPEMIRIARERSAEFSNIEYQAADVMEYDFPVGHFDFAASFLTLHHVPLEQVIEKIKAALKPGGTLLVFDICDQKGIRNKIFAFYYGILYTGERVIRRISRMIGGPRKGTGKKMKKHDPDEIYPTFAEVSRVCQKLLPGAQVREQYGLDRYFIVWKKP
jgi:SAM-dependent methyltransferase